jgi:hypothetical protein
VPDFARPVKVATNRPARSGWEQRKEFWYESPPNQRLVMMAQAFRKGRGWTVLLVSSSESSHAKRNTEIALIQKSLKPAGYTRETFQGKAAHTLDTERIQLLRDFVETARAEAASPASR